MKKNNKKYALKEMSKVKIIDRRSEKSIKGERDFLSKLHHPFIVNMACAFQDYENLYLVMDLLTGGDLRYHLCRIQKFTEEETKFFIACLLLGLEYIHGNNIIHRDIKPENLVCDERGYIRITDFGVAKVKKEDNSSETSGTPGYMAPEVLLAQNHSFAVDFFAIGIMGYEFMFGERPYVGRSRKEIKHSVLRKQAKIEEEDIPNGWSIESVDFINKCLKRKQSRRLGYNNGISELKNHEWFNNYNWEKLYSKNISAPFIPKKGGNYDRKYCEAIEKLTDTTFERYQSYMNHRNFGKIFAGYTYINYELIHNSLGIETNTRMTTNTKQSKLQSSSNITINNNSNKNPNVDNKDKNNSQKEIKNAKLSNNYILDVKYKEKIEEKIENNKDKENKENSPINNILVNSPKNQNKKNLNFVEHNNKNEKEEIITNKENNNNINNSNNSIYNNINNNFKKIKSLNEDKKNMRSTSVDISSTNLKSNLSHNNMNIINQKNKELNMNFINNNFMDKNEKNKFINGSLSNPNRDKISYKFKNNAGISSPMLMKKNNTKREISSLYNSNNNYSNFMYKKRNNFIQLRQNNQDIQNDLPFYLPNLNKNSSFFNAFETKKKPKLNLNQLKLKINNFNIKKDFANKSKNRFLLSPTNRRLKKSQSSSSMIKSPMNSSTNNLAHKNNIKNINNLFSAQLKKNYSNFGNDIKRTTFKGGNNNTKRKKYKDINELY